MFFIRDVLIAEGLKEARFGCNLDACKGNCCVEGDRGAPLEKEEVIWIQENLEIFMDYLDDDSRSQVQKQGPIYREGNCDYVSMHPDNGACLFLQAESGGFKRCLFEKLFEEGVISWQKPISCHLFPLLYRETEFGKILNFEKRSICSSGWGRGPLLVKSLRSSLLRKFGKEFVEDLFAFLDVETED